MSDTDPMDEVEARNGMRNMAVLVRAFYEELIQEGFSETEALAFAMHYVHGLAGGKSG